MPQTLWLTFLPEQGGAITKSVNIEGHVRTVEHLRKVAKKAFQIELPHLWIGIFLPDFSKPPLLTLIKQESEEDLDPERKEEKRKKEQREEEGDESEKENQKESSQKETKEKKEREIPLIRFLTPLEKPLSPKLEIDHVTQLFTYYYTTQTLQKRSLNSPFSSLSPFSAASPPFSPSPSPSLSPFPPPSPSAAFTRQRRGFLPKTASFTNLSLLEALSEESSEDISSRIFGKRGEKGGKGERERGGLLSKLPGKEPSCENLHTLKSKQNEFSKVAQQYRDEQLVPGTSPKMAYLVRLVHMEDAALSLPVSREGSFSSLSESLDEESGKRWETERKRKPKIKFVLGSPMEEESPFSSFSSFFSFASRRLSTSLKEKELLSDSGSVTILGSSSPVGQLQNDPEVEAGFESDSESSSGDFLEDSPFDLDKPSNPPSLPSFPAERRNSKFFVDEDDLSEEEERKKEEPQEKKEERKEIPQMEGGREKTKESQEMEEDAKEIPESQESEEIQEISKSMTLLLEKKIEESISEIYSPFPFSKKKERDEEIEEEEEKRREKEEREEKEESGREDLPRKWMRRNSDWESSDSQEREERKERERKEKERKGKERKEKMEQAKEVLLSMGIDLSDHVVQLSHEGITETQLEAVGVFMERDSHWFCLHLAGNEMIPQQLATISSALENSPSIQEIDLSDNFIGDEGAMMIAKVIQKNKNIRSVNVASNKIGSEGAKAIAEALKENKALKELNLAGNEIGVVGARAIAKMLKENKYLQELDLSQNGIDAETLSTIAIMLKENRSLKHLGLIENQIGDAGAFLIADLLEANMAIRSLKLSWNGIGKEGTKALAEKLKGNKSLHYMIFSENKIGNEGAQVLAEMLLQNRSLRDIHLYGDEIGDRGAKAFEGVLLENLSLRYLDLSQNCISKEEKERLKVAAKKNPLLTLVL